MSAPLPAATEAASVPPAPPRAALPGRRVRIDWAARQPPPAREYLEVLVVIGLVTVFGWMEPFDYRAFGHVYLLAVIVLSLRVGRWPVLFAACASAIAWEFAFIPPKLSFSMLDLEDDTIVGTYFVAALIAGQLTARIRAQERTERQREQHANALLRLTEALAAAATLDEAVAAALRQADELFEARTALLLSDGAGARTPHPAGSFRLTASERAIADDVGRTGRETLPGAGEFGDAEGLHWPVKCGAETIGVLVVASRRGTPGWTAERRGLVAAFAVQIAFMVEREQLRAAGEREKLLAASDRLHRTLLDSVSHELKTPLAVLSSAAEKLARADEPRREALTTEIRTATGRLDRLVANLLDQTRLESGAIRPRLDWCDARDLIRAARRSVGEALAGRPVTIEVPVEMPLFQADAHLMDQVLTNLLLNVARHTPPGTPVTISAGVEPGCRRVFLAVTDRGPGLAPEMKAHLFEKFHRGPRAAAGGVGLGLSIVHGLMLAQGGSVAADAPPEGGARFTVSLPLADHDCVPPEE